MVEYRLHVEWKAFDFVTGRETHMNAVCRILSPETA
jgi:hypothetical protein